MAPIDLSNLLNAYFTLQIVLGAWNRLRQEPSKIPKSNIKQYLANFIAQLKAIKAFSDQRPGTVKDVKALKQMKALEEESAEGGEVLGGEDLAGAIARYRE